MGVEAVPGRVPAGEQAPHAVVLARVAAGIAHELRNPLAVILARVQLLRMALTSGKAVPLEKLERALQVLEEQATRAARVVESVSAFARPRAPDRELIDVAAMLGQVLGRVRPGGSADGVVRTNVDVALEARTLLADRAQLAVALTQLVTNALEAMSGGGVLELRARRSGDLVEFSVADTGPGVPAENAGRIFEPFFSTKPAAAGLGLAVAQTIVTSHGGALRLVAAGGPGAEFVMSLPVGRVGS